MKLSILEAVLGTFLIGLLMFGMRALPFIVFRNRKTPAFFRFIEKFIPAISIAVLFMACLKEKSSDILVNMLVTENVNRGDITGIAAAVISSVATVALHLWKKNAMLSIFGGTILFMILNYTL